MAKKIVAAFVPNDDHDVIEIVFSDGYKSRLVLYIPENEVAQIDGGIPNHDITREEWEIIDKELTRFSLEDLGVKPKKAPVKFTKADIDGVQYAIDILDDQIGGGSQDRSTLTNLNRLKRLLSKLQNT